MNYDITFCSKTDCDKKCERNQKNIPKIEYMIREIWVGDMIDCEYWKGKKDERN